MKERLSENQESLGTLVFEGQALVIRLKALSTVSYRTTECQSVNASVTSFLARLSAVIPADDNGLEDNGVSELILELTAVSRNRNELLLAYLMRAMREHSDRKVLGVRRGETWLSSDVAIRPAFAAQMPAEQGIEEARFGRIRYA